jgi:Leucine-rich repeat (LRR) protein
VGGILPYELQNLTILEVLALQRGFIKGSIPSTLGNLKNLKVVDLNLNNITGSIPENLYNAKTLEQLDLNDNELSGTVSPKIGDLKNLFFWQLGNDSPWGKNTFDGTIPPVISGLTDLRKFFVANAVSPLFTRLVYILNLADSSSLFISRGNSVEQRRL